MLGFRGIRFGYTSVEEAGEVMIWVGMGGWKVQGEAEKAGRWGSVRASLPPQYCFG